MKGIEFENRKFKIEFLDPSLGFERKELFIEIRRDCLTGHISRVLPFRRRRISGHTISQEVIEESRKNCPFCPTSIPRLTPKFTPETHPEGRLKRGSCTLFPNQFPYASQNWVTVLSEEHFIPIEGFRADIIRDGFILSQEAILRVEGKKGNVHYSSINWNYLPAAGGGIIHPHLQVVAEEFPTFSHRAVLEGLKRYGEERGGCFWEDYLSEEMERGERYLGSFGEVHFIVAFSPRGVLGEIIILFFQRKTIGDLSLEDWGGLAEGLLRIFSYMKDRGIESFNLSIFSGNTGDTQSWVYGRFCPRLLLPPWGTSDINYFEKLHGEVICIASPEELCEEMRAYFSYK